jgi:hypothetical protein
VKRWFTWESAVAAVVLSTVVFLGWPVWTKSDLLHRADCGCPAPKGECEIPCSACCDLPETPQVEPCPCEDPTHDR